MSARSESRAGSRPTRRSLSDGVHEILLARLVEGSVEPGSPLNIDALSRDLEVSPTPIREALARLESTGLVERTALRGYRAAPLFTERELADLMDARAVIEPVLAERAAARVTSGLVDELLTSIEGLRAAPHGPSFAEFRVAWRRDEEFHELIAQASDNAFLLRAYHALGGQVQRFRLFGGLGVTDAHHAVTEHTAIVDAIAAGDEQGARLAMTAHITGVRERAVSDRAAIADS
ncbi:MAG: GntR family transcriptional regulator [Actinomycetota bacterium]|nr:GntR family transcriptional regulator [Actinomycetota bacterium]